MADKSALAKYKQTSITTASRGKLLLMLYESCIKNCRLAIDAIKARKLNDKGNYILKIQDIINELSLSLNHEVGGELSKELERLYSFMIEKITEANAKNDPKPLEVTLGLLEKLYQGWIGAVNQVEKNG